MVKHAGSRQMDCQFDSSMCHFQNAIGEETTGSRLLNSTSLENTQRPVSGFFYTRDRACSAVFQLEGRLHHFVLAVSASSCILMTEDDTEKFPSKIENGEQSLSVFALEWFILKLFDSQFNIRLDYQV